MSAGDDAMDNPDPERRKLLAQATAGAGGVALAGASLPFAVSLWPSERSRAQGAPVEADLGALRPEELRTVEWRGKPVWILRRTPAMLASLDSVRPLLSDADSGVSSQQPDYARNRSRSRNPETFVTVALCTHLGCIPSYYPEPGSVGPGSPGGFFCPCHGSKFDFAGRVYRGSPAPTNLMIPPYAFAGADRLVIGLDDVRAA